MTTTKKITRKKEMFTVSEVAKKLKVTAANVRVWIHRGRFPGAELTKTPAGSYWLVPIEDIQAFKQRKAGRPKKTKKKDS
jgi:excisionase family DNA binding protein